MYRRLELEASTSGRAHELLAAALEGGRHLTRPEVAAVPARGGIVASGSRLGYLLMHAELSSLVCSGPLRDRQHTYVLVDERVPPAPERSRDDALAALVLRYVTSHGPATARDLRWWASLTAVDVRTGLALVGDRLDSEIVDDVTSWSARVPPARACRGGRAAGRSRPARRLPRPRRAADGAVARPLDLLTRAPVHASYTCLEPPEGDTDRSNWPGRCA